MNVMSLSPKSRQYLIENNLHTLRWTIAGAAGLGAAFLWSFIVTPSTSLDLFAQGIEDRFYHDLVDWRWWYLIGVVLSGVVAVATIRRLRHLVGDGSDRG